jgi:hypothetical protein
MRFGAMKVAHAIQASVAGACRASIDLDFVEGRRAAGFAVAL